MFDVVGLSSYVHLHPSAHLLHVCSGSGGFVELSGMDTKTPR